MAATPIFAGSSTGLVPLPGAVMTKNAYGIDVLSRPFYAPRASVGSYVPSAGTADIVYSNLKATGNYSITEDEGLTCKILVEYKGLLSGSIPEPLHSSGLSSGCASGSSVNTDVWAVRNLTMVFASPAKTKRYIAEGGAYGPPSVPDSSGVVLDHAWALVKHITDGTGRIAYGDTGLEYSYETQISNFTANPVPGTIYYECEATWKAIIVISTSA